MQACNAAKLAGIEQLIEKACGSSSLAPKDACEVAQATGIQSLIDQACGDNPGQELTEEEIEAKRCEAARASGMQVKARCAPMVLGATMGTNPRVWTRRAT